jgi:predicted dehydrogenase
LDELAAILSVAAQRPELKLMFGFNHRYHGSVQKALEVHQSGRLGRLLTLRGVYGKPGHDSDDWRRSRALAGGGILLDQGIHMLDLMRLFAGEFEQVQSQVSASSADAEVEDVALALMRTQSGVMASFYSSAIEARHRFTLELGYSRGEIILDGILSESMRYAPETVAITGASAEQIEFTKDGSFASEVEAFASSVHNNSVVTGGGAQDAYAAMALVYRIYCADPVWREQWNLDDEPREGVH